MAWHPISLIPSTLDSYYDAVNVSPLTLSSLIAFLLPFFFFLDDYRPLPKK